MPRILKNKATAEKRLRTSRRYVNRIKKEWVDPYPEVHGTLPEKMVYAELTRLGIPFYFLNDLRFKIPEIAFDKYYQADFMIPSANIIIEVQGAYWHSKLETIEADAFKFAIYETSGYKVLAWYDFDIIARLHDLIISEPAIVSLARSVGIRAKSTELTPLRRTKVDTSQGIRTLNSRRKIAPAARVSRRRIRKARRSYATQ